MMSDEERRGFEGRVRASRWAGARGRQWLGMYELYVLPAGMEFPASVESWLMAHGFVRRDDPINGPFWERPASVELEVA